ncbi:hypothetical protein CK503_15955 [Aliifodinibius salipaludis]|uniref:Uncharacterized protein n=1 Tax=Fodinibius salipaludis TaxID=2032627 RepID=A0A2A2G413_9BACT|nr:hypothetical protein CK503_15955 [Aliifodinibius salipaludis]
MKTFFQRNFSYIMENKKKVLPQVFIFYFILAFGYLTIFLPVNIWTTVNFFTVGPLFIWSFFRTLGKMEKDNMSYWDCVFVVIVLPFLMLILPFVLALVFGMAYLLIFNPQ